MKRIQLILAAIAAIAATVAGLDLTGFVTVLPPELAKWLVIIPSAAAAVVHIVQSVKLELEKVEEGTKSDRIPMFGVLAILAALLFLPSCADLPVLGSISYRDPSTGAKGGLVFTPGEKPSGFVKVPIRDPETGEIKGYADLAVPLAVEATK